MNVDAQEIFNTYQHLSGITLRKLFPETELFANSIGMQKSDLLQFALMGCWVGSKSYNKDKHSKSIKAHLIRNIKWYLLREIQKQRSKFQFYKSKNTEGNKVTILSLNSKLKGNFEDEETFEDITSVDNIFKFELDNPEKKVLSSIGKEQILKLLKPADLELIRLRIAGLTMQEISDMYGKTRQSVSAKFIRMQKNLSEYLEVI